MTSFVEFQRTVAIPGWRIPTALTLPEDWTPNTRLPSAIFLCPGSLFSDVNGDYPAWNSYPHVYAHLAQQLSARGHAVFRYAKLGPGTGSEPVDEPNAITRTWDGRLAIAVAVFHAMRAELESRGVRADRLVAAGHSEGSVVVSRMAVSEVGSDFDAVMLLSGPSVGIISIMREQGADLAVIDAFPPEGQQYMRDCEATDPTELARRIPHPTLVVQGGNDSSVRTHHGERLRDALSERGDYLFVPDVTHMYKVVPEGTPPQEAFGYPGVTDVRVTDGIDKWLRARAIAR
jgi:uncharacterized protein